MADRDASSDSDPQRHAVPTIVRGPAAGPWYLQPDGRSWRCSQTWPALCPAPLDPRAVAEALVQGYVSPPETLRRGVTALRPGETANLQPGRLIIEPAPPPSPQRGGLRPALLEVVTELGAGPVGLLLSGGVDSAWLAALAAQHGPAEAFTTVFPQLQQVDFAADVATQVGLRRHVVEGDGRLVWAWLNLIRETGLPQPDLGAAAVLLAAEEAVARGLGCVLSGLGADEVCGGRPAAMAPSAWAQRRLPPVRWAAEDARQAYGVVPPRCAEWTATMRLRAELLAPEMLQREPYLAEVPPAPAIDPLTVAAAGPAVGGWLVEYHGRLGTRMLPTVAALERLTGARIALPYLDPRVVARGLAEYGPRKPAIRHGSRRELPDQIRARPKLARRRPDAYWLLGDPLPPAVAEAFSPQALAATAWFDPVTVHHWLQLVRAKPDSRLNRLRTRLLVTAASIQILARSQNT